jgi:hypothetical protein
MIEKRDLLYLALDFLLFPEKVHDPDPSVVVLELGHVLHDQLIVCLISYVDVGLTHKTYLREL